MELKFDAPRKKELLALEKYNVDAKEKPITVRNEYPRHLAPYFKFTEASDLEKIDEYKKIMDVVIAKCTENDIIIPDPAPQEVCDTFVDKYPELEPILAKDSIRCFLRLFEKCAGQGMSWDLTITAQTLTFIVSFNALRCAKAVLEGMAPELHGMHANPNCINTYGFFALHEAAERFSLDMIKLLLRHGASPNVRTVGSDIIENLLPLHVAVENTCLHKYLEDNLEDNLSRSQNHLEYIYKLIHLLCLPEMKIFLDTTRLLAGKTNNLLLELWNYIEDGKIIQSAVLLLAAQEQICGGRSTKKNGSIKNNGLDIITKCIVRLSFSLRLEKCSHGMTQEHLEERKTLIDFAWLLVDVFSYAGEDLSAYIQAHSEVPHVEVFQHVSSILREYGFCPTRDIMDTINLRPYDCRKSGRKSCEGLKDANMAVTKMTNPDAAEEKAVRGKVGGGWDPTYAKRSFFPHWRSVLLARFPVRMYPAYASNYQPRRCFITAATGAFRLLKVLK